MALWDSGKWDAALWSAVLGTFAATETGVDTLQAVGTVTVEGDLIAQETGVDVFVSSGHVETTGVMAATETGVDLFVANGFLTVAGDLDATETGVDVFRAVGSTQTVVPQVGESYMRDRRKRWDKERDQRDRLRAMIASAVSPMSAKKANVVPLGNQVAIVAKKAQPIPIPVPPQFDSAAVVNMIVAVMREQEIRVTVTRNAVTAKRAHEAIERQEIERERKRAKRRRDDELLLLM